MSDHDHDHDRITIRIEIPALERFVEFLSDQRDAQRVLNSLADQLNQSSAGLQSAINKENK